MPCVCQKSMLYPSLQSFDNDITTREDALTIEKCKVAIGTITSPSFQVYLDLLLSIVTASPSILPPSKCT